MQELESVKLLNDLLRTPENFEHHCKRFSASLVYTLSYGKRLAEDGDLEAILGVLRNFVRDTLPGAHLVDTFPILDLLPDILSPWRQAARKHHNEEIKVRLSS